MDAKTFEAFAKRMGINEDFSYGQYLHSVEHSKYSGKDIQDVRRYFMEVYGNPTNTLLRHQCNALVRAIQANEFSKLIDILGLIKTVCAVTYARGYFDGRDDNAGINPKS